MFSLFWTEKVLVACDYILRSRHSSRSLYYITGRPSTSKETSKKTPVLNEVTDESLEAADPINEQSSSDLKNDEASTTNDGQEIVDEKLTFTTTEEGIKLILGKV